MVYKKGSLLDSFGHDQSPHISPPNAEPGQASEGITAEHNVEKDSDMENVTLPPNIKKGAKGEKKRVFGLSQGGSLVPTYISPDDYAKRYPPDEWGEEMGPNARVWRVYLDEAELNDRDMVEGWKDGIDVLLVFAGLFSAVVTTFVTQTSQKLDQDPGLISASMLTQLAALQWALATGSSLDDISPPKLDLSSPPQYLSSDAWVNGLWFTSLALSLVTALYAVLIKQWVQNYVSFISGTPQERARIHHFRYMGIQRWSVPAIIGILPVLLYAALFLFLLGLVVFLQALKQEIAYVVATIGGIAFVLYLATNALPVFYLQCPYRTPLIEHVRFMIYYAVIALRQAAFLLIYRLIPTLFLQTRVARLHKFSRLGDQCKEALKKRFPSSNVKALKVFESKAAEEMQDEVVVEVINWLLTSSSNPSVKPITLESISGLRFGFSQIDHLLGDNSPARRGLLDLFQDSGSVIEDSDIATFIDSPLFYTIERRLRAFMFSPRSESDLLLSMRDPITPSHLQMHMPIGEQPIPLQQALTTYIVHRAAWCTLLLSDDLKAVAADVMPTLLDVLSKTGKYPMVWHAWLNHLKIVKGVFECPNPSLASAYSSFKPFLDASLSSYSSPGTWASVAPLVGRVLPSRVLEGHHDLLTLFPATTGQGQISSPSYRDRFRVMLVMRAIEECKSRPSSVAELEGVVAAAMEGLWVFGLYYGWDGQPTAALYVAILEELYSQPFFVNDSWSSQTYKSIFSLNFGLLYFETRDTTLPSSKAIPLRHLPDILANERCTSGLIHSVFSPAGHHPVSSIHDLIQNTTQYLDRLEPTNSRSEMMVKNLFAGFDSLHGMPNLSAPSEDPVELDSQWANAGQPLVRWMLEKVIAQDSVMGLDEKEHTDPTIQAFATRLVERADVLTFVCSSFLIVRTMCVFSNESQILLRLATYHKGKPGAADVWHAFVSWIVAESSKLSLVQDGSLRNKKNLELYPRMSDFVDQLVIILGMDGSEFRLPPLAGKDARVSTGQGGEGNTAQAAEPSTYLTTWKRSNVFQKLICWKARPDVDANREEIELESNERAVAEKV